ncbi:MAG: class I tRNA ligase family protein, partial [Gammaproteobacteria bacterium]|nr:class I tRNA ligase family protein [Gammaproteobacteria bacterium]
NVLDPIDLIDGIELEALVSKRTSGMMQPHLAEKIEKQTRKNFPAGIPAFGTDALRFTFAAMASTGRDIILSMDRLEGYRNFCNKLWNAARYVLMNTEDHDCGTGKNADIELSAADRWILSRLQETEAQIKDAIETYRFDHMAQSIYEFTWNEYCDWYLELTKPVLMSDQSSDAAKRGTRRTLIQVLETLLRLAHPLMPFITEEIWQKVGPLAGVDKHNRPSTETIMLQPYPVADESLIDPQSVTEIEWVKTFILGVRKIRSSMDIKPGKPLPVLLQNGTEADQLLLRANQSYLESLAKIESIQWLEADQNAPESATALVGEMKLLIPMAGLIDKDAELKRLNKEIEKLEKEIARVEGKLNNENFISKAPETVVEKERAKITEASASLDQLKEQQSKIEKL